MTKPTGRDVLASLVVFLVALPLCMGIAIASGVPPAMGLVSGVIGGIVVGTLAGSPLQVSGPAAGLAVIVYEIVHTHGIEVLGPMIFVAGLLQMAAGAAHVGQIFRAVAPAVVRGMLAGIGVLIFASQFHVMVDDKPGAGGLNNLLTIPTSLMKGLTPGDVHFLAASVGVATLVTLIAWNAVKEKMPGGLSTLPAPLLAVFVATAIAYFGKLEIAYVEVPTELGSFVRLPTVSTFGKLLEPAILGSTIALACIASAESLLCAVAVDKLHEGERTDFDKELMAQGAGNAAAGLLGALPVTGVIVRSTANVEAGGTTRWSAILHGFWLLFMVALLPFALAKIPVAALAAILVHIGYKLVNFPAAYEIWERNRLDFAVYFVTVAAIVATNLLEGLLIGLALAVLKLAWTFSRVDIDVKQVGPGRIDVDIRGAATFVALPKLARTLEALDPEAEVHIHLEHLSYIDHACFDLIADWERQRESAGGTLVLEWDELHRRSDGNKKVSDAA